MSLTHVARTSASPEVPPTVLGFVTIVDIDEERARSAGERLGARVSTFFGDVRLPGTAEHVVSRVHERHGKIDVLVNNIGHYLHSPKPFESTTEEEWEVLYAVSLHHVFGMTRAVLGPMIGADRGGSIINMSTVEAVLPIPQHPVHAAFKAGVTHFGRSLDIQVARHGIRVNDIAPDVTRSEQLPYDRWLSDEDRARIPTWSRSADSATRRTSPVRPSSWRRTSVGSSPARRSTVTVGPAPPGAGIPRSGGAEDGRTGRSIPERGPSTRAGPTTAPGPP